MSEVTAAQQIRISALDAAVRTMAGVKLGPNTTVRDLEQVTVGMADRLADWITDGDYDWMAADDA